MDLPFFPAFNACLNGTAFVCLLNGFRAIRRGQKEVHRGWMIRALAASTLFLVSYVTYHLLVPGVTRFAGQGILKAAYLTILVSHTILAAAIVPFVIMAVRFAMRQQYERHKRITRWLLPVWMYVSSTGVIIFLMLFLTNSY